MAEVSSYQALPAWWIVKTELVTIVVAAFGFGLFFGLAIIARRAS